MWKMTSGQKEVKAGGGKMRGRSANEVLAPTAITALAAVESSILYSPSHRQIKQTNINQESPRSPPKSPRKPPPPPLHHPLPPPTAPAAPH